MSIPTNQMDVEEPIRPATQDTDELDEGQLDEVSGGLNPQPEPPGRHLDK